jgi:hypothetical protein
VDGIPAFEAREGYPYEVLPDGVYVADEPAVQDRFVARFPASATRLVVCGGLFRLRGDAVAHGICATQWVDGSFVESKVDPADVDVVSFIDYDAFNALPLVSMEFAHMALNGREGTVPAYLCHTFSVLSCRPGDGYAVVFERARVYWRKWLGQTFDKQNPAGEDQPRHDKGFVAMALGDASRAPVISTARS